MKKIKKKDLDYGKRIVWESDGRMYMELRKSIKEGEGYTIDLDIYNDGAVFSALISMYRKFRLFTEARRFYYEAIECHEKHKNKRWSVMERFNAILTEVEGL